MLKNASLLAIVAVHTAENEPSKVAPCRCADGEGMSNFKRLVLGCIDSYDSEQRRIFQHFSRSTRFASFCTALISKFADVLQFFSRKFPDFPGFLQNVAKFQKQISKI